MTSFSTVGMAYDDKEDLLQNAGKYEGPVGEKPDISELIGEKEEMTEAEEKMSSAVLKLANSHFLPEDISQSDILDQIQEFGYAGASNEVYVYIEVSGGDFDAIKPYVSSIENSDANKGLAAAWVGIDSLSELAALDDVVSIREVVKPIVYYSGQGSEHTEGTAIHNVDDVIDIYGADGSGVKIGIISDGVDSLSSAQASGDLPWDVTVLSNAQSGDEGTAMLEIVYDMAPGADLFFHDCGQNVLGFCDAIDDLVAAGCDVVCDDIGWLFEPYFEDGTIASHIDSVLASTDIVYASSAGNSAISHHQSTFRDAGSGWHDFSGGSHPTSTDLYAYIPNGGALQVIMQWNEAFGSAGSDYNLYLYDLTNGEVLTPIPGYEGQDIQNGNDDPIECLIYENNTGGEIDVAVWAYEYSSSVDRILEVNMYSYGGGNYTNNITAADSIFGHAAVPDVIACGAIDASDPGNDNIESFSSRGPVTMLSETRSKTSITGIDGVSVTGAGGFPNPFFGTSAAAPHIAAIAGVLRSRFPMMTRPEIQNLMFYTAVDLGNPGYDYTYGYGRADAYAAATAVVYCHFDSQGGSEVDSQLIINGNTATEPPPPTHPSLEFGGWYQEPECTTPWNFSNIITADTELYAKWTDTDSYYVDDIVEGKLVRTHYNGSDQVTAVVYYRGATDDSARDKAYYYSSDVLYFMEEFGVDDTIIASTAYWPDGVNRQFKNYYDHGLLYFQEEYDISATIIASIWFQPDGVSRHFKNYYNGGTLYFQEEYDATSTIIASIWFQPDGVSRHFKNYYSDGVLIFQEEYDATSTIIASIWFHADGVTRYLKQYYSGGVLYFQEETNTNGVMIASIDYWPDGETRQRKCYYQESDGALYLIEYYDVNGNFVYSERFGDETPDGLQVGSNGPFYLAPDGANVHTFIPGSTRTYTIYSQGNTDTVAGIFRGDTCLVADDDSGESSNFRFSVYLTA